MGYWGTVVVARPHGLLVDQGGVTGFGHQQHWLRELGDGWQMLEVTGFNDPPDLLRPCQSVVATTGHPVLAAYVSDSDCAVMCAATPGWIGPLTHLWELSEPCPAFQHQPDGMAVPVGRSLDEVVAELAAWSESAGLRADTSRLRAVVSDADDDVHVRADDAMFEMVKALGVERIGRTLPWSLPAYDLPFSAFMSSYGPAFRAREYAIERADPRAEFVPAQPWEAPTLALETELWTSLYRTGVDVPELARRAAYLYAEYRAAPRMWDNDIMKWTATVPPTLSPADVDMLADVESRWANGIVARWSKEFDARRHADARATTKAEA